MVSAHHLATGVGGATLGLSAAEITSHARERDMVTDDQARLVGIGSGVGALALGGLGTVTGHLGTTAAAGLGGYGLGSIAWYVGREQGVVPRITIDVPAEVNLAGPVVTALALSTVGIALSTVGWLIGTAPDLPD